MWNKFAETLLFFSLFAINCLWLFTAPNVILGSVAALGAVLAGLLTVDYFKEFMREWKDRRNENG